MTITLRIDGTGGGAVATVDDRNRWCIVEGNPAMPDEALFELLPRLALQERSWAGRFPSINGYAEGVLRAMGGEVLNIASPFEHVPGRIY